MTLLETAALVVQVLLGLVGLAAGGSKVASRDAQVEAFERYGYSQRVRVVTGAVETVAGTALLVASIVGSGVALAGAALFGGVMVGAVSTHVRIDDPVAEWAVPAVLLLLTVLVLGARFQSVLR